MKPKKTKKRHFFRRIKTIFASSLIRFTKGVKLFTSVTDRPAASYPKTQEQRDALCPELYVGLRDRTKKLIAAREALEQYYKGMKNPRASDPGKSRLSTIEDSCEMELMQIWALLEEFHLVPVNKRHGVKWKSWKAFAKSARRDESIFDKIEPVDRIKKEEAVYA